MIINNTFLFLLYEAINSGIGLSFFGLGAHFWLYITYCVILIILEVALHIIFTVNALRADPEGALHFSCTIQAVLLETATTYCRPEKLDANNV